MGGVRAKIRLVFLFFVAVFLVSATATHSRRGGGSGEHSIIFAEDDRKLSEMVPECHQSCRRSTGDHEEHIECVRICIQNYGRRSGDTSRKSNRDDSKQQQSNNPYVFEDHHFTTKLKTELGSVRVLQKFTNRSELFRGIEKYRVGFLEAEPQTFIVPNHWDADALLFVEKGEGTISLIKQKSRQSFNIKRGDIFRVPAGISVYLINKSKNEQLVLVKILRSISVPGELQSFVGVGGENPKSSFFGAFSTEVLEAAFDTNGDELERLLWPQKQEQGIFKKATEEQIGSLSGDEGGVIWPLGERKGPYNVFKKNPSIQNDHGNLREVDSDDYSDLRDIHVAFSLFNITQGSMAGPFYNAKATTVLVVPNGEGRFEMAYPHLAEESGGLSYEKVRSWLRRGNVAVIPAGHPIVMEASGSRNLEVIAFGVNADENEWFPLAGRDNVMSQWEDTATELTFGVPASEVKKVIQKQKQRLFFKGPERQGRAFV